MNGINVFIFALIFTSVSLNKIEQNITRDDRILNIFSVVRFPNKPCQGNDAAASNGTCYAADECSERNGAAAGSCAGGYGVCCTFELGCGQRTSENCSYFISTGTVDAGQCRLTVCPCSDDICQLRLDFQSFIINQPEGVNTVSVAKVGGKEMYDNTQCQIDIFSVTAPGNNAPPVICGTNTGEHMYMDASDMCNELAFNLGSGTSAVTRNWRIKITQYDCNYNNLAPDGCTQYFFGETTDIVKTYNFDGGHHLASQDQNICVRRERNVCQICWAKTAQGDFETSSINTAADGKALLKANCCNYGTALDNQDTAYDCAIIPGASKATDGASLNKGHNGFCGGNLGSADDQDQANTKTICSKKVPFNIRFLSDLYETDMEKAKTPNGFKLAYILKGC